MFSRNGFLPIYDAARRIPRCVVQRLHSDGLQKNANRKSSSFHEDDDQDPRFAAYLDSYRGSGYDRGHMAAARDHSHSKSALTSTFQLDNIAPQIGPAMNRGAWERLERYVRGLCLDYYDVTVVSGPLFLPRMDSEGRWTVLHEVIGGPLVGSAVPTHFFKAILARNPK